MHFTRTCGWFGVSLLAILAAAAPPAMGDPLAYWYRLSESDRAEIQKTLTVRLPAALPEEAQPYATTLAQEIPRWGAFAGHLEQGEYAEMVGLYADDLAEYVDNRFDEMLPNDGVARGVYQLVKANPDAFKRMMLTAADPSKSWDDVRDVLWEEVNTKIQDFSQSQMERVVKDIIDDVLGKARVAGYSAGQIYILGVKSWVEAVQKFGPRVEAAAANQLYRQYRIVRGENGGSAAAAEEHVRDLWVTEFVPGPDGQRLPASWTARLAAMKLGVEDLLPLFNAYYSQSQGQGDRFHEWLDETSRRKIQFAQARIREQARVELEEAREKAQEALKRLHAEAARQLREEIERHLTAPEKSAREDSLRQASVLLGQMRERNAGVAQQACAEFTATQRELEALDMQVRGNRTSLRDLAFHIAEAKRIEQLGDMRGNLEAGLAALVAAVAKVEANTARAEQEALGTCSSAGKIAVAASKEQGRQHLDDALAHAAAAGLAIAAAETSVNAAVAERDRFLTRMRSLTVLQRDLLREAQAHLQIVDAALADLRQRQALETQWNALFARLAAAAGRHEAILGAFEIKASRIDELLSAHNRTEAGDAFLREVNRLRGELNCLRVNLGIWASADRDGWVGAKFPAFATPDPQALREARELVAVYSRLAALPELAQLEAAAQAYEGEITAIRTRIGDARFRMDACAARAIVDFDRTWLKGDLTRVAAGGDAGDAKSAPASRTAADGKQPAPADLAEGLGNVATTSSVPVADLAEGLSNAAPSATGPSPGQGEVVIGISDPPNMLPVDRSRGGGSVPGRTGTTTADPRPAESRPAPGDDQPLWAVYSVHPYPTAPRNATPAQLSAWKARVTNERTFAPEAQPGGYLAFRVTGDVLRQYREYQRAIAAGDNRQGFPLFQPGGHYYQVASLGAGNQRLALPLFLKFFRLESAEPTWVNQSQVGFAANQPIGTGIQQMSNAASAGSWRGAFSGQPLPFGNLLYTGQENWDAASRRYGSQAMRFFIAIGEGIGEAIGR